MCKLQHIIVARAPRVRAFMRSVRGAVGFIGLSVELFTSLFAYSIKTSVRYAVGRGAVLTALAGMLVFAPMLVHAGSIESRFSRGPDGQPAECGAYKIFRSAQCRDMEGRRGPASVPGDLFGPTKKQSQRFAGSKASGGAAGVASGPVARSGVSGAASSVAGAGSRVVGASASAGRRAVKKTSVWQRLTPERVAKLEYWQHVRYIKLMRERMLIIDELDRHHNKLVASGMFKNESKRPTKRAAKHADNGKANGKVSGKGPGGFKSAYQGQLKDQNNIFSADYWFASWPRVAPHLQKIGFFPNHKGGIVASASAKADVSTSATSTQSAVGVSKISSRKIASEDDDTYRLRSESVLALSAMHFNCGEPIGEMPSGIFQGDSRVGHACLKCTTPDRNDGFRCGFALTGLVGNDACLPLPRGGAQALGPYPATRLCSEKAQELSNSNRIKIDVAIGWCRPDEDSQLKCEQGTGEDFFRKLREGQLDDLIQGEKINKEHADQVKFMIQHSYDPKVKAYLQKYLEILDAEGKQNGSSSVSVMKNFFSQSMPAAVQFDDVFHKGIQNKAVCTAIQEKGHKVDWALYSGDVDGHERDWCVVKLKDSDNDLGASLLNRASGKLLGAEAGGAEPRVRCNKTIDSQRVCTFLSLAQGVAKLSLESATTWPEMYSCTDSTQRSQIQQTYTAHEAEVEAMLKKYKNDCNRKQDVALVCGEESAAGEYHAQEAPYFALQLMETARTRSQLDPPEFSDIKYKEAYDHGLCRHLTLIEHEAEKVESSGSLGCVPPKQDDGSRRTSDIKSDGREAELEVTGAAACVACAAERAMINASGNTTDYEVSSKWLNLMATMANVCEDWGYNGAPILQKKYIEVFGHCTEGEYNFDDDDGDDDTTRYKVSNAVVRCKNDDDKQECLKKDKSLQQNFLSTYGLSLSEAKGLFACGDNASGDGAPEHLCGAACNAVCGDTLPADHCIAQRRRNEFNKRQRDGGDEFVSGRNTKNIKIQLTGTGDFSIGSNAEAVASDEWWRGNSGKIQKRRAALNACLEKAKEVQEKVYTKGDSRQAMCVKWIKASDCEGRGCEHAAIDSAAAGKAVMAKGRGGEMDKVVQLLASARRARRPAQDAPLNCDNSELITAAEEAKNKNGAMILTHGTMCRVAHSIADSGGSGSGSINGAKKVNFDYRSEFTTKEDREQNYLVLDEKGTVTGNGGQCSRDFTISLIGPKHCAVGTPDADPTPAAIEPAPALGEAR